MLGVIARRYASSIQTLNFAAGGPTAIDYSVYAEHCVYMCREGISRGGGSFKIFKIFQKVSICADLLPNTLYRKLYIHVYILIIIWTDVCACVLYLLSASRPFLT